MTTLVVAVGFLPLRRRDPGSSSTGASVARATTASAACERSRTRSATGRRAPGGDRRRARGGARRPARRSPLLASGDGGVRGCVGRARRTSPTTPARERQIGRDGARTAVLLHDTVAPCVGCDLLDGVLSAQRRSPSRWPVSASSSASSWPRSRPRGPGSSRRATRSAAGSSATSTTARSSGSSLSASRCGGCSEGSRAARPCSPPRSTVSSTRSAARSGICGRSPRACDPRGSTTASRQRSPTSPRSAPIPVVVDVPQRARPGERRGGGLLRRVRGAHERRPVRIRVARVHARRPGERHAPGLDHRRRHRRGGRPARLGPRRACRIAWPPTADRSPSSSPRGRGTRVEVAIPCES